MHIGDIIMSMDETIVILADYQQKDLTNKYVYVLAVSARDNSLHTKITKKFLYTGERLLSLDRK